MKIVIAGGKNKADYLIRSLLGKKHKLIVINDDEEYCAYLARTHHIPIVHGDPCLEYVLQDADIRNYDLLISLRPVDADNLVICQMAKKLFGVQKTVSIVANPKNVDIFQKLGVNTVISATHMVVDYIEQASTIESLVNTLTVEHGRIMLTELLVDHLSPVQNKHLMDVSLPPDVIISCIVRGTDILVPRGDTELLLNDKLIMLSAADQRDAAIRVIMGERD